MLLSDFDLIAPAGSQPEGKIFGSPLHIAPEILRDEIVVPQSDHYSVGVMLLLLTHQNPSKAEGKLQGMIEEGYHEFQVSPDDLFAECNQLAPLINSLMCYHHIDRPRNLGHVLTQKGNELGIEISSYENQLLWPVLKTRYRLWRLQNSHSPENLHRFLEDGAQLYGSPKELATDFAGAILKPAERIRAARRFVLSTSIARYGEFFFASSTLDDLVKLYGDSSLIGRSFKALQFSTSWQQQIISASRLKVKGQYLKAIIAIRELLCKSADDIPDTAQIQLCLKLGDCCRSLGYSAEAEKYFKLALASNLLPPVKQVESYLKLADLAALEKDREEHDNLLKRALILTKRYGLLSLRLKVLQKQLWTLYQKGQNRRGLRHLSALAAFASKRGFITREIVFQNTIGCIEWTLGNLDEAKSTLETAIKKASDLVAKQHLAPPYVNLGLVCYDRGEYKEAVNNLMIARNFYRSNARVFWVAHVELNLFSCFVLLGDFERAEKSMADYLDESQAGSDQGAVGWYHLNMGWLNLRRGEYRAAEIGLRHASEIFESVSVPWHLGRSLLFLGTLYCWQGKFDLATALQLRANKIFQDSSDKVYLLDSKQLHEFLQFQRNGKLNVDACVTLTRDYLACANRLGACSCLVLFLLSDDHETAKSLMSESETLRRFLASQEIPFAQAVFAHSKSFKSTKSVTVTVDILRLKEAFRLYLKTRLYFHALQVCLRIAKKYEQIEKVHLRLKFLREAHRLAKLIGNKDLADTLYKTVEQLALSTNSHQQKNAIFHSVSSLLVAVSDYQLAVRQLLQLALEETGAERGALLLATENGRNLRVETIIDCDRDSLRDIINMSKSVMQSVFDGHQGMFIENALEEETTKSFKSIFAHNIMSIACVPLVSQDKLIGVIYLDHHTLPGLFGRDERQLIEAVANFIAAALAHARALDLLQRQREEEVKLLARHGSGTTFVTRNSQMKDILQKLPILANSNATILLRGESGTGKEILATMIHHLSPYRGGPFVTLNCALLRGELSGSDLFGIEKGVATGVSPREGKLQAADGGTLFLDEIGDMPFQTQAELLRVIETRQFTMIGSNEVQSVDVRFIAATNKDLNKLIDVGAFRSDLYYRINTVEISLPALRERPEDVELLVEHFVSIFAPNRDIRFSRRALDALNAYQWPGNVRDLRNHIERICILHSSGIIEIDDLRPEITRFEDPRMARSLLRMKHAQTEKARLIELLMQNDWNRAAVARILNLPYTTLVRRLSQYGITNNSRSD